VEFANRRAVAAEGRSRSADGGGMPLPGRRREWFRIGLPGIEDPFTCGFVGCVGGWAGERPRGRGSAKRSLDTVRGRCKTHGEFQRHGGVGL
jgi:hypothetical protein